MERSDTIPYRRAALALIFGAALLRLAYLAAFCPLDLSPDEAHYWDWSRHLDWCYHSKGPLVAWLIRLSCALFGDTMLAVRLPAVACGALLLAGLHALTLQVYGSRQLALIVVALALSLPVLAAGSSLMTIDAPFLCAWMWALVFCDAAQFRGSRWGWPAAGVCILVGMLAKHTMVLFVPCVGLFLLTTPALRGQLRSTGFWIMTMIGGLGGVPIVVWNVHHDWVTLNHTRIHAGLEHADGIRWLGPIAYVGTQAAVLLGFWFAAWVTAMWVHRPTREARPEQGFLWWLSAPVFVFFACFSLKNGGGEANWPLATYLSGGVLVAGWLAERLPRMIDWQRRIVRLGVVGSAALGLLVTIAVHDMVPLQPVLLRLAGPATPSRPMPLRRLDPTSRLRGWRYLAGEVDRVRAELLMQGDEPVLAGERWTQTSELGFYCADHPDVYCLGVKLGDRDSQYDLWRPNPVHDAATFHGKTFILVGVEVDLLRPAFARFGPVQSIEYRENGQLIAAWKLAVARDFRGWDATRVRACR